MHCALFSAAALVAFGLAACHSTPTHPAPSVPAGAEAAELTAVLTRGTYRGTEPCADCSGIDVMLTFAPDHTVVTSVFYQDRQDKPTLDTGTWVLANHRVVQVRSPHNRVAEREYRLNTGPEATLTILDENLNEYTDEQLAPYMVLTRDIR